MLVSGQTRRRTSSTRCRRQPGPVARSLQRWRRRRLRCWPAGRLKRCGKSPRIFGRHRRKHGRADGALSSLPDSDTTKRCVRTTPRSARPTSSRLGGLPKASSIRGRSRTRSRRRSRRPLLDDVAAEHRRGRRLFVATSSISTPNALSSGTWARSPLMAAKMGWRCFGQCPARLNRCSGSIPARAD